MGGKDEPVPVFGSYILLPALKAGGVSGMFCPPPGSFFARDQIVICMQLYVYGIFGLLVLE